MKYAKLIDGNLQPSPNPIYIDPYWVGNPTPEMLTKEGYKPVQYADQPEPQGVGRWEETWTETEDAIVQGWEAVELPPEMDISPAEALDILLGGEPS